jgi:hypothetical protein
MDQNYLEKVTFNILDAHPSDPEAHILESYTFKVSLKKDDKLSLEVTKKKNGPGGMVVNTASNMKTTTREEVHAAMQKLVRTLMVSLTMFLPELQFRANGRD